MNRRHFIQAILASAAAIAGRVCCQVPPGIVEPGKARTTFVGNWAVTEEFETVAVVGGQREPDNTMFTIGIRMETRGGEP